MNRSDFLLAVDHEGKRHALFSLPPSGTDYEDSMSRGLTVHERTLVIENDPLSPFLDLTCADKVGHRAFNMVISEILEQVQNGSDPVSAVRRTLAKWRRFWGAAMTDGLSAKQVLGLFGELWFLLTWVLPFGANNLGHWDGPVGARHDFHWPNVAVEAKTTTSTRGHIHRINGLDQLDPPDHGTLYIFSLRVREEPEAAHSLVSMVERLMDSFAFDSSLINLFEDRLGQVGYSPAHRDMYASRRFHISDQRLYCVGGSFPRISVESFVGGLPTGVERVEYEINLETCLDQCISRHPKAPGIIFAP